MTNFNKNYTPLQSVCLIVIALIPIVLPIIISKLKGLTNLPWAEAILFIVFYCMYAVFANWVVYKVGIVGNKSKLIPNEKQEPKQKKKSIPLKLYQYILGCINSFLEKKNSNKSQLLIFGILEPEAVASLLTIIFVLLFILIIFGTAYLASYLYYKH